MSFDLDISIPALTVWLQGALSFFSPCVFPLVPLYIGYFSGGAKAVEEDGTVRYPRGRVFMHTVFFVLGISVAFFLMGFGFTALGRFFSDHQLLFARISGVVMILFGLYQLGVFGQFYVLERERRLPIQSDRLAMGPLPFLAVGLFTGAVLEFFNKHKNVVRYTVKIGALLLIFMGVMTLTGLMNDLTGYLSRFDGLFPGQAQQAESSASDREAPPAPDFTLTDQNGNIHTLSDYKGQTVFLNFWAT